MHADLEVKFEFRISAELPAVHCNDTDFLLTCILSGCYYSDYFVLVLKSCTGMVSRTAEVSHRVRHKYVQGWVLACHPSRFGLAFHR